MSGKRIPNYTRKDSIKTLSRVMFRHMIKKLIAFVAFVVICIAISLYRRSENFFNMPSSDSIQEVENLGLEPISQEELIIQ